MLQEWINPLRNYKLHLLIYVIYKFPPGRNNNRYNNGYNIISLDQERLLKHKEREREIDVYNLMGLISSDIKEAL